MFNIFFLFLIQGMPEQRKDFMVVLSDGALDIIYNVIRSVSSKSNDLKMQYQHDVNFYLYRRLYTDEILHCCCLLPKNQHFWPPVKSCAQFKAVVRSTCRSCSKQQKALTINGQLNHQTIRKRLICHVTIRSNLCLYKHPHHVSTLLQFIP